MKYGWFDFYNDLVLDHHLDDIAALDKFKIAQFYKFGAKFMENKHIRILVKSMEWWYLRKVQLGALGVITNYEIWRDYVRLDWDEVAPKIIFRFKVYCEWLNTQNSSINIKVSDIDENAAADVFREMVAAWETVKAAHLAIEGKKENQLTYNHNEFLNKKIEESYR